MRLLLLVILFSSPSVFGYFYPKTYSESRNRFQQLSLKIKESYPKAQQQSFPIFSLARIPLSIDSLYIPAKKKTEHLVILTSGIHGIEGFTGAALQIEFLEKYLQNHWFESMGLLVVHAVNPYGFHFKTRVDESNVDLNRNISATSDLFEKKREDYKNFESFLNPREKLSMSFLSDTFLFIKSIIKLLQLGKDQIAQVALGGQYQNPKGVYFGGFKPQQNSLIVKRIFQKASALYDKIYHVDIHTGYGERGKLHLFSSKKVAQLEGFDQLFSGYSVDLGSDEDFYETSGDFTGLSLKLFSEKTMVIPMTFEFGTMNSQTTWGGFFSLRNMIFENQGRQWGYQSPQDKEKIQKDFVEMFNPSEKSWRDKAMQDGIKALSTTVERFQKIQ